MLGRGLCVVYACLMLQCLLLWDTGLVDGQDVYGVRPYEERACL
jgi:hypothetical protein